MIPAVLKRVHDHLGASNLRSRFIGGAFWSVIGATLSRGMTFVAFIVVARILKREDMGKFGVVQATIDMFQTFAGFGLGLMATRYVARYHRSDPERTGRILALSEVTAGVTGLLSAIALIVLSSWLAARVFAEPGLTPLLRISAVSILFGAMNGAQTGALVGLEAFRSVARVSVFVGMLGALFVLCGVLVQGILGVVWGLAIGSAMTYFTYRFVLRRHLARNGLHYSLAGWTSEMPLLWRFAFPAALSGLMVVPATWFCRSLLAKQPGGFAELGLFAVAEKTSSLIGQLSNVLGAPLVPLLAGQSKDLPRRGLLHGNMLFYWILGLALALPLLAIPEILGLVFGADFAGPAMLQTTVLMMLAALFRTFKAGLANANVAAGRMWWSLAGNGIWGAVLVGATFLLVGFGAIGMAAAVAIAYAAMVGVFIPIAFGSGLVPRGTIFSPESLVVWFAVGAIATASGLSWPWPVRAVIVLGGGVVAAVCFHRLIREARGPNAPTGEGAPVR